LQLLNVASAPDRKSDLIGLREILMEWMQETGDNVPESFTPDWYLRKQGYTILPVVKG